MTPSEEPEDNMASAKTESTIIRANNNWLRCPAASVRSIAASTSRGEHTRVSTPKEVMTAAFRRGRFRKVRLQWLRARA